MGPEQLKGLFNRGLPRTGVVKTQSITVPPGTSQRMTAKFISLKAKGFIYGSGWYMRGLVTKLPDLPPGPRAAAGLTKER